MSLIDLTGHNQDYRIVQGDTIDDKYALAASDGSEADLSAYTVHGVIESAAGTDMGGTFTKEGSAVRMQVSSAESALFVGEQFYQIEVRSSSVTRTVVRGVITTIKDRVN